MHHLLSDNREELVAHCANHATPKPQRAAASDKQLYFAMLAERGMGVGQIDELTRSASRTFLCHQLHEAAAIDDEFAAELRSLPAMLSESHKRTAAGYAHYLSERRAGSPRRFFSCRAHAMYFLRAVAPTKLVDGAWLYGLLRHWQDPRLAALIQIYLEELGCGMAPQNHVLLYTRLLARYGCDQWQDGPERHFTQGAVQLALAHHADEFLPELMGFNLGYEQLPLHLPITAYELNELDIDPYYFSLHVTIDNASTGHARKALQSVLDRMPRVGDANDFYRRVGVGYRLNQVGMGTESAIESFDLERELQRVVVNKAAVGAQLHSDYCRIGGRAMSDWLGSADEVRGLLEELQSSGWIQRGRSPEHSRFWQLLTNEQAPMFGVFDGYEQQLLSDWIWRGEDPSQMASATHRFRTRPLEGQVATDAAGLPAVLSAMLPSGASVKQVISHHSRGIETQGRCADVAELFDQLSTVNTKAQASGVLEGFLSPANHPTPAGLAATRLYADLFSR